MNPNWAEENLQTIRTLMERSALYRRALAPIMLGTGLLGVTAAAALYFRAESPPAFAGLWLGNRSVQPPTASLMMGFFFGALHLGYGFYLYVTERKNPGA